MQDTNTETKSGRLPLDSVPYTMQLETKMPNSHIMVTMISATKIVLLVLAFKQGEK